jgi:hypothetical protein
VSSVYGVFPGEDLINDEIAKPGRVAWVQVSENVAVLSFLPSWNRDLGDAVDAGIERFRAAQ